MMLIQTCCADCVLRFIEAIKKDIKMHNEEIVLFFYNPNIHPHSEFRLRQTALQKISAENDLKLIIQNWTPKEYFNCLKNLDYESRNNRELRCPNCWRLRLKKTFIYAKENNFSCVSTTLVSSIYHKRDKIIGIGKNFSEEYNIGFYIPEKIDPELKTSGFYKQNYCGCVYSLKERMEEKYK